MTKVSKVCQHPKNDVYLEGGFLFADGADGHSYLWTVCDYKLIKLKPIDKYRL